MMRKGQNIFEDQKNDFVLKSNPGTALIIINNIGENVVMLILFD